MLVLYSRDKIDNYTNLYMIERIDEYWCYIF